MADCAEGDEMVPLEKGGTAELGEPDAGRPCWATAIPLNAKSNKTQLKRGVSMTHPLGHFRRVYRFCRAVERLRRMVRKLLQTRNMEPALCGTKVSALTDDIANRCELYSVSEVRSLTRQEGACETLNC
jgi:hypothetical protein